MFLIMFYFGIIDVLFTWWHWWESSTVTIIFTAEIIVIITGILVGLKYSLKRTTILCLLFLDGVGLFLVAKELLFGYSHEKYMLMPFLGELLAVGTTIALLTFVLKRIITSR